MKIAMDKEISEDRIKALIYSVAENLPEASMSVQCVSYDYEDCVFVFIDEEDDDQRVEVNYEMLRGGFNKLINMALGNSDSGSFYAPGWDPSVVFGDEDAWEEWEDTWDAAVIDGLVQCAIYGDIILG